MEKIRFGKTGWMVSRIAFGGIPIQRLTMEEAVAVVRGVIALGVNFLDTANGYTDSEEKIGRAIQGMPRESLVIATKSGARDKKTFLEHVNLSLKRLGVAYVDLYQLHNLSSPKDYATVFGPGGAYEGLMEAVAAGKVRCPAFSSHNIPFAMRVMKEGKFAAVQLPFNYVDDEAAKEAIPLAKALDMGFIAMKPFGGGLLRDAGLSIRYLAQFDGIVPDPGIETLAEMEEIVAIAQAGGPLSAADAEAIARVKAELGPRWCHRCDYCQPCPQNIPISMVLNTESLIRRMPFARVAAMAQRGMETARSCIKCGVCAGRCPYGLDIPALIEERIAHWERFVADNGRP